MHTRVHVHLAWWSHIPTLVSFNGSIASYNTVTCHGPQEKETWMRNIYCYWSESRKEHILENLQGEENGNMNIMFCWPCISIYSFKEKPTWCTIYLQYILSNISTCFRCIYSSSSGGTPYGYNWYLLFFLDDCLLSWQGPSEIFIH